MNGRFPCRLLIDQPAAGDWNMAVDEALLEQAVQDELATVRLYQWREPTLSLGYFQPYDDRDLHPLSGAAPVIRRPTGGGALLHHHELTYSICLPNAHPWSSDAERLYTGAHQAVIASLETHGVTARLFQTETRPADLATDRVEPFLCFQRRTAVDVVIDAGRKERSDVKILGSAQRRRRRAILQHGGLLLAASPLAPELAGIAETTGIVLRPEQLADRIAEQIAERVGLALSSVGSTSQIATRAPAICAEKYARRAWTMRR